MRKLVAGLFVALTLLFGTVAGMQIAGDTVPDGNGANPPAIQVAGDTVPGGNG